MKRVLLALSIALAALGTALPASAQVSVYARFGPPAPVYEAVPPARPGYVWIAGSYDWVGGRYVWTRGHYMRRPYAGAVWVAPRWEAGAHRYHRGYWRRPY